MGSVRGDPPSLRVRKDGAKPLPHLFEGHLQGSLWPLGQQRAPGTGDRALQALLSWCPRDIQPHRGLLSWGQHWGWGIRLCWRGGQYAVKKRGWGGLSPLGAAASLDGVSDSQEGFGAKNPPALIAGGSGVGEGVQGCLGVRVWP